MSEQPGENFPNRKRRGGCGRKFLWGGALLALAAGVLVVDHRLSNGRKFKSLATAELAPGLSVEVVEQLSIANPTFTAETQPSLAQRLKDAALEWVPFFISWHLLKWGWISPPGVSHGTQKKTFTVTSPEQITLVYQYNVSDGFQRHLDTSVMALLREIRKAIEQPNDYSRSKRYSYILASSDRRYNQESSLAIDPVFHHGTSATGAPVALSWNRFHQLQYFNVPARYPELDLIFVERNERDVLSSTTTRMKNPRYTATPKEYGPAQPLPATATDGDLSMTVRRFVADAAHNWRYERSRDGEYGYDVWNRGEVLRSDIEDGAPCHTIVAVDFARDGQPTPDWQLSAGMVVFDETGEKIRNGGMTFSPQDNEYTMGINVGMFTSPMKVAFQAYQTSGFPDDQLATVSVSLAGTDVGPVKLHEQFLLGPHNLAFSQIELSLLGRPGFSEVTGIDWALGVEYEYPEVDDRIELQHVILESDTTGSLMLTYSEGGIQGSRTVPRSARFKGVNMLGPRGVKREELDAYTMATVVMSYSPVRSFEFVLEPKLATVPVQPPEKKSYIPIPVERDQ